VYRPCRSHRGCWKLTSCSPTAPQSTASEKWKTARDKSHVRILWVIFVFIAIYTCDKYALVLLFCVPVPGTSIAHRNQVMSLSPPPNRVRTWMSSVCATAPAENVAREKNSQCCSPPQHKVPITAPCSWRRTQQQESQLGQTGADSAWALSRKSAAPLGRSASVRSPCCSDWGV